MKISLRTYLSALLLTGVAFLSSCSKDDDDPSNVITDSEGVVVTLEWTTGGTSSAALSDADLDLYIYKDGNEIASSEHASSFETAYIANANADGTYLLNVYGYDVTKGGTYTIKVTGQNVTTSFTFTGPFTLTDDGHDFDAVKVVKSGTKYTVTKI